MKFNSLIIIGCFALVSSCQFFNKAPLGEPIARVNNSYLYAEDLKGLIDQNTTKEDSTLRVSNFINKWATQQLLLDAAQINLSEARQEDFEGLVQQYKTDLFTSGYKEALVKQPNNMWDLNFKLIF